MSSNGVDIEGAGALFQIAEPTAPATAPRSPGLAIGIDLGTTHSLVAVAPNGADPRVLGDDDALVHSVVSYGIPWSRQPSSMTAACRVLGVKRMSVAGWQIWTSRTPTPSTRRVPTWCGWWWVMTGVA